MKKLTFIAVACVLGSSLYAADGAEIYKKCSACHGAKADKQYANKVPALASLSVEYKIKALEGYKDGSNNKYGMGSVMKSQVRNLSKEDMKAVSEYIQTLK